MNQTQVINKIDNEVFQNNYNAITGSVLNGVLHSMFENIEAREIPALSAATGSIVNGDSILTILSKLANAGGGGAYVPLSGTTVGAKITGPLEYDQSVQFASFSENAGTTYLTSYQNGAILAALGSVTGALGIVTAREGLTAMESNDGGARNAKLFVDAANDRIQRYLSNSLNTMDEAMENSTGIYTFDINNSNGSSISTGYYTLGSFDGFNWSMNNHWQLSMSNVAGLLYDNLLTGQLFRIDQNTGHMELPRYSYSGISTDRHVLGINPVGEVYDMGPLASAVAIPANEFVFGTGTGVTSNPNYYIDQAASYNRTWLQSPNGTQYLYNFISNSGNAVIESNSLVANGTNLLMLRSDGGFGNIRMYAGAGSSAYGLNVDRYGLRVSSYANLGAGNTPGLAFQVDGDTKIGTQTNPLAGLSSQLDIVGNVANGYVGSNIYNATSNGASSLFFTESSTRYALFARFNTAYTGNIFGIPYADNFFIDNSTTGSDGTGGILTQSSRFYNITGTTATDNGFVQDRYGFRVGPNNSLGSANTYAFQVNGDSVIDGFFMVGSGSNKFYVNPNFAGVSNALWLGKTTPSPTNFSFQATANSSYFNAITGGEIGFYLNNATELATFDANGIRMALDTYVNAGLHVTGKSYFGGSGTASSTLDLASISNAAQLRIIGNSSLALAANGEIGYDLTNLYIRIGASNYQLDRQVTNATVLAAIGYTPVPYTGATTSLNMGTNNVSAARFIVPSGLSTQFLKADGTTDPRTYNQTFYKDGITSAGLTGVTTNTLVKSVLVLANTFVLGDVLRIAALATKITVGTGTISVRIYTNTTNDLTGTPVLIAANTSSTTALVVPIERYVLIKNTTTNTQAINVTSTVTDNNANLTTLKATLSINWTVNQYIIIALQNSVTGDTVFVDHFIVTKF